MKIRLTKNKIKPCCGSTRKIWVAKMLANDPYLEEITNEYRSQGLENFSEEDGTPISLKAILFNRYEHWLEGGTDGFKRFYRKTYLCL